MNPWPYPRLFAHRGGGTLAPENTLAGIRMAHRRGYRAVEFDVMLAGCGTPVLIHDETLERTTNGRGRVSRTPYELLQQLDAGSWHGPTFAGEPVPSFEDAARLCRELGLAANVEIKPAEGYETETGTAAAELARVLWQGAELAPLLSSFSIGALQAARNAAPELPLGLLFSEVPVDWLGILGRLGAVSLHCEASRLRGGTLVAAREAGVPVLCYTVNDPAEAARLLGDGVAGLFTDRLDLLDPAAL